MEQFLQAETLIIVLLSVVSLVAGGRFEQANAPVAIIAWAIPITFANMVLAHMVVAANEQRRAVPVTLAAIVLNVLLNVLLIPRMGAAAPALVTVITEGLGAAGIAAIMIAHYHFGPSLGSAARILVAGALSGLSLVILQAVNRPLAIVTGVAVYLAALAGTRAVTLADVRATLSGEHL